ncbi:MAG: pilus assembly protein TadG-related protein, partial [Acidobacteriota bacterium]
MLGAVGLFIMALGVIATLNIGQAVSERIRLQNAADAAAYSLAAEEARLFNFFAFTNRAQVAHYAAAMTVQSYVSYLTYMGGLYGSLRDLIWDAASIYQCICDLNIDYPPISPPYCIAAEAMAIAGDVIASVLVESSRRGLELIDGQAADIVEALYLLNRAIWRAQLQQGLMLNLLLTSGAYPYVGANDPAVDFGLVNGFNAVFNQLEFNQVFDRGAGLNFSLLGIIDNPSDIWSPRIH